MDVDPQRSLSLGEFCYAERISKNKYYELKKRGLGPDVTDIDGFKGSHRNRAKRGMSAWLSAPRAKLRDSKPSVGTN